MGCEVCRAVGVASHAWPNDRRWDHGEAASAHAGCAWNRRRSVVDPARRQTIELAIQALPLGGTAVLVGMTPFGVEASFEVYPFVDGSRRILGSNYGFADPAIDFPRYAQLVLDGRLPVDRLIDRRIGLDDLEPAFDRLRSGEGLRQVIAFD